MHVRRAARLVAFLSSFSVASCGLLVGNVDPRLSEPTKLAAAGPDASSDGDALRRDAEPDRPIVDLPDPVGSLARVSVGMGGAESDGFSDMVAISGDGRFVVFASSATNLVAGDKAGLGDIFLRDRTLGKTTRLSVAPGNVEANAGSDEPSISVDGQLVAFGSGATNLTRQAEFSNQIIQIGTTPEAESVSLSRTTIDCFSPAVGGMSSVLAIAFVTDAQLVSDDQNEKSDVYIIWGGRFKTDRLSGGRDGADSNEASDHPAISEDGDVVAFESRASNLVAVDTNATRDVFARVRSRALTVRVSVDSGGAEGNSSSYEAAVSADGSHVAFTSEATNLARDDTNGVTDVFVHDMKTGETARASVASDGTQANGASSSPTLSRDGRVVAFLSAATNLDARDAGGPREPYRRDLFAHDLATGKTYRVTRANEDERFFGAGRGRPAISADGRVVVFPSDISDLVEGDTNQHADIFAYEFSSAPWLR